MEEEKPESSLPQISNPDGQNSIANETSTQDAHNQAPPAPVFSQSGLSSWAKNLKFSQPGSQDSSSGKSGFSRFASGFGLQFSSRSGQQESVGEDAPTSGQSGMFGSLTKGLLDSSVNAVKTMQVRARHMVSQNKRRYQEDGFDLDLTYITENIIAMGFPAGDLSSGLFGYFEGFYRNHMEEVIKFFEKHHKGKYKVYNLCSERLYDPSLLEGKVACFPFDDHNCPPTQLIISFCQSAYTWLKENIENVVVVHCKAGMARTGLMISSLLLYLKFFPTAIESIEYYNQKRCVDGKGLVLPSQIRYVKYFEQIVRNFNCENPPPRRCMVRGFRLHRCPYWVRPSITISSHNGVLFSTKKHPRTKDLMPEDFWFSSPKKGIMVFALPGEPGLTEVAGDFKIHFHDRQGDFYCWLNTTMMENRLILTTDDLDDFDKRKLPSPGFQLEVVLVNYDGSQSSKNTKTGEKKLDGGSNTSAASSRGDGTSVANLNKEDDGRDKDDVFSDGEVEEGGGPSKSREVKLPTPADARSAPETCSAQKEEPNVGQSIEKLKLGDESPQNPPSSKLTLDVPAKYELPTAVQQSSITSEFKAIAADASVFSFGDEDYESE